MRARYVIAAGAVLLAGVGASVAQPQPKAVPPQLLLPPPIVHTPPPPPVAQPAPALGNFQAIATGARVEPKPDELTIDQLIEAVDGFRELKAEIEKKERAYLKVLHKKADKQKEKIDGLGGEGLLPPPPTPQVVPGAVVPSIVN